MLLLFTIANGSRFQIGMVRLYEGWSYSYIDHFWQTFVCSLFHGGFYYFFSRGSRRVAGKFNDLVWLSLLTWLTLTDAQSQTPHSPQTQWVSVTLSLTLTESHSHSDTDTVTLTVSLISESPRITANRGICTTFKLFSCVRYMGHSCWICW